MAPTSARLRRLKRLLITLSLLPLAAACIDAPTHDDPDSVLPGHDDIPNNNAFFANAKDDHWYRMFNPMIDGEIQAIINSGRAPGCAVGVVEDGEIQYMKTYGRIRTGGPKWTMETVSPVASVSKTFTAAAIMRLQERGLLDIDHVITAYLPSAWGTPLMFLTIRDLLSHRTGLPTATGTFAPYTGCPGYPGATREWCFSQPALAFERYKTTHTLDVLDFNKDDQPKGQYSNIGYSILGAVIDRVSRNSWLIPPEHKGYEAYLWHTIGHYQQNKADIREMHSMAIAYDWRVGDFGEFAEGTCPSPNCEIWGNGTGNVLAPAGYWALTIGDLTRFTRAQIAEEILSQSSWDQMRTPHTDTVANSIDEEVYDYGLGMQLRFPDGLSGQEREYWHGGDHPGYTALWLVRSTLANTNNDDVGVAIICNGGFGSQHIKSSADGLVEVARRIATNGAAGTRLRKLPGTLDLAQQQNLDGRRYKVKPERSRLSSHDHLFIPMLTDDTWNVEMRFTNNRLRTRIYNVRSPSNTNGTNIDFGALTILQGTHAQTTARSIIINSIVGPMRLDNAVFRFAFNQNRQHLTEGRLSGTLDMRQVSAVSGGPGWEQMCATSSREDNQSCRRCSDGVRACLTVSWERLGGPRVSSF